ncbi:hypothetical protein RFI_39030, partial [Reticulomyxa filosa]
NIKFKKKNDKDGKIARNLQKNVYLKGCSLNYILIVNLVNPKEQYFQPLIQVIKITLFIQLNKNYIFLINQNYFTTQKRRVSEIPVKMTDTSMPTKNMHFYDKKIDDEISYLFKVILLSVANDNIIRSFGKNYALNMKFEIIRIFESLSKICISLPYCFVS